MFKKLVEKIVAPGRSPLPEILSYEEARKALEDNNLATRRELSAREDVEPEILYFLAGDTSAEIRGQVAANPTTPRHADALLAGDSEDGVREELARKIGRLIPDLSDEENSKIRELTIETLEKLANDHLPRIRQLVADEIKHNENVPLHIVRRLAKDAELIVCGPILEYSPLLSDEDLLEIIASGRVTGALEHIAKRGSLSETVSDAVVATLDIPAVAALLNNANAQIREDTLDQIIDNAEAVEAWHEPLVMRPDLSVRAIRRIAGFVASSLVSELARRHELDAATENLIKRKVRLRIDEAGFEDHESADPTAAAEVEAAAAEGRLNADFVAEAIEAGNRALTVSAIARLAGYPEDRVNRILRSSSPKGVVSLAWKAGLPMRNALPLQSGIAKLKPSDILQARDGVDYPMTEDEMTWHLTYFETEG
ncbi:MAG: DUF2336 domain-containing protein [Pseudomonadota bacterium]